jgi:hypothetical protein
MIETPVQDLLLVEGEDYLLSLVLTEDGTARDMTGYSIDAEIRTDYDSGDNLVLAFTSALPVPAAGEILLSLTDEQVTDLIAPTHIKRHSEYLGVWDLFMVHSDGDREYLVGGRVRYQHTVSRRPAP